MKKKKLNSKNPKYWDKSQLTEKKVIKEVIGKAAIRNSSGNIVGKTTVRGVWYEQCYTRARTTLGSLGVNSSIRIEVIAEILGMKRP